MFSTAQAAGSGSHLCECVLQVVYVGDGNNIVHSWIRLAAKFNFEFVCACPKGFEPDAATIELANSSGAGHVSVSYDPMEVQMIAELHCLGLSGVSLMAQDYGIACISF